MRDNRRAGLLRLRGETLPHDSNLFVQGQEFFPLPEGLDLELG